LGKGRGKKPNKGKGKTQNRGNKGKNAKPKVLKITQHRRGKTNIKYDEKKKALPPGKRQSKSGKVYYENRRNRSDKVGSRI